MRLKTLGERHVWRKTKDFVLDLIILEIFIKYSNTEAGRQLHLSSAAVAAAKLLQSCLTLCDPTDGSHQAPPSLGFSRQEHWSGLPFLSPMHESEN